MTGYSFGGAVAFEIAAQMESSGDTVILILLDGSPGFVVRHTEQYKSTRDSTKFPLVPVIGAYLRFALIFKEIDLKPVRLRTYYYSFQKRLISLSNVNHSVYFYWIC